MQNQRARVGQKLAKLWGAANLVASLALPGGCTGALLGGCTGAIGAPNGIFGEYGYDGGDDEYPRDAAVKPGSKNDAGKADAGSAPNAGKADSGTNISQGPSDAGGGGTSPNADAGTPNTGSPPPVTGSAVPVGGPAGYTKLVLNDVFGSSRAEANITSTSQFNPSTGYGASGTGWDTWQKNWNPKGTYASVAMKSDHLEIVPTNTSAPGFIVSHFEAMPSATVSYYIEVRAATGRGAFGNGSKSWPAIWLYAGNESNANDQQSEIDIMETYTDEAWGTLADATGLFLHYFATTIHTSPNHKTLTGPLATKTPSIDVTTTQNVYGCELTMVNGQVMWKVFFNGAQVQAATTGLPWKSSAPAILVGWNPGSSPNSNAVLMLDYVRVWSK